MPYFDILEPHMRGLDVEGVDYSIPASQRYEELKASRNSKLVLETEDEEVNPVCSCIEDDNPIPMV